MATMASPKSACGTPMTVGTRNGFNGRFDGGIDVIATRNDEVLGASGNVDVAFRIDIAEVAGDENAVEQASKSPAIFASQKSWNPTCNWTRMEKVEAYRSKVKLSFKYEGS